MAQTLGLISIIWNGTKIAVEKGGTFQNGGLQQKPNVTGQQVDYSNEFVAGKVSCTSRLMRGQLLSNIWVGQQAELQIQCDTGQTYTDPEAFLTNLANFTAGDGGKVKLEFAVGAAAEVING
jgi:hypothetical protein